MGDTEGARLAGLRDRDLAAEGLVVAEGRLVAERLLLEPRFAPLEVLCVPALEEGFSALVGGRCPLLVRSEAELAALAGYPFHRGVLALAERPPPLAAAAFLAALVRGAEEKRDLGLLLLPSTRDPENLGALARSAAALGLSGLVLGPATADLLSRRVLRVSMGAVLALPSTRLGGPGDLEAFLEAGFSLAAALVGAEAREVEAWEPGPRTILALGDEYAGLDEAWTRGAATRVTIPMAPGPDSLNVAAAGAILMARMARRLVPRPLGR